jgi:hypothetical protein
MERSQQRDRGSRWVLQAARIWNLDNEILTLPLLGPAHAVYFGTYEAVKEWAGGNIADGKHHPAAAGTKLRSALSLVGVVVVVPC